MYNHNKSGWQLTPLTSSTRINFTENITMERLNVRRILSVAAIGVLSALALEGCSWNDLNPSGSVTHGASADAGATKEILAAYPGATDIEVTHADDNPNYMSWETTEGEHCTAFASQTQNKGKTPGALISVPYCRDTDTNN